MRVLKFGGSSLADTQRIGHVAALVAEDVSAGPLLVVVSATGDTTDHLLEALDAAARGDRGWHDLAAAIDRQHRQMVRELGGEPTPLAPHLATLERLLAGVELLGDCPPSAHDRILATGERCSVHLLGAALTARGVAARVVDPASLVVTDDTFGRAAVDRRATAGRLDRLLAETPPATVIVTGGFVGAAPDGRVTTLGRGGSDLSATLLGALAGADRVEIWTDVRGVHTAPPRLVPEARPLARLSYAAAAELAALGAAVLHPRCVEPAAEHGVPIVVRSTLDPAGPSTLIGADAVTSETVHAVAALEGVVVAEGAGQPPPCASRALQTTLDPRSGRWLAVIREEEMAAWEGLESRSDLALVALVGEGLARRPWVAGRALEALGRHGVPVERVLAGASEHSLTVLVPRCAVPRALETVHAALQLGRLADRAAERRRPAA